MRSDRGKAKTITWAATDSDNLRLDAPGCSVFISLVAGNVLLEVVALDDWSIDAVGGDMRSARVRLVREEGQ